MSKRQAKEFIDALVKSAALRRKVNVASEDIVKVARQAGFKITRAEIAEALKDHWLVVEETGGPKKDPLNRVLSETPGF